MSDLKLARTLLAATEWDIAAFRRMGDPDVLANEIPGFHTQYATEKLFKANLIPLGEPYPTTRDLMKLLELLKAHRPEIQDRFGEPIAYSSYAVQSRHSAGDPELTPLDRDAVTRLLEAFIAWSRKNLARAD